MPRDPFAVLGLAPGRYSSTEIRRRYYAAREPLLTRLAVAGDGWSARQQLDDLHWAYRTLISPENQERAARMLRGEGDRIESLRLLIEASLEDGLLRASRRAEILEIGKNLGVSEFHTHLLIAQTQFGDLPGAPDLQNLLGVGAARPAKQVFRVRRPAPALRTVSALALAVAMFSLMWRWMAV